MIIFAFKYSFTVYHADMNKASHLFVSTGKCFLHI